MAEKAPLRGVDDAGRALGSEVAVAGIATGSAEEEHRRPPIRGRDHPRQAEGAHEADVGLDDDLVLDQAATLTDEKSVWIWAESTFRPDTFFDVAERL